MKKLFALLLAVVLVFSLCLHRGRKTETPAESTDASATAPVENTKQTPLPRLPVRPAKSAASS